MPRKVDELPLRNGGAEINTTDLVLVVAPDTNEIFKSPAADFRGASVFVSENPPTDTPDNPDIPRYISGDVYYEVNVKGMHVYEWNSVQNRWDSLGFINGARTWDATSIGNASLDISTTSPYFNPKARVGDFYLNKSRRVLFGPYTEADGWNFSQSTYLGWQHMRGNIQITVVGNDTKGYDNPTAYLDPSPNPLMKDYAPKTGDTYWLQKPSGNGHGGYIWTFDENRYSAATGTRTEKLAAGWGTREYYRKPALLTSTVAPVQDNNTYRDGDSVVDSTNSVLYSNYQETAPNGTTDLAILFGSSTSLKGSSILSTTGVPSSNDGAYVTGDYIFTTEGKTTRLHGPYLFGAATDVEAWPLAAVVRQSITHTVTGNTTPPTSYIGDYPYHSDGTMIVNGDLYRMDFGADKSLVYTDGVVIDYVAKTLDWGTGIANERPPKFWTQTATTWPAKDNNTYFQGDFIITGDNRIYGPYNMSGTLPAEYWPRFSAITGRQTVFALNKATDYVPSTDVTSADWGGNRVEDYDELVVTFASGTKGKQKRYLANVNEVSNTVAWTEIPQPPVEYSQTTTDWPVRNDADYRTGDFIVTLDGIKHGPYLEGQANDVLAWPFHSVVRGIKTFSNTGVTFPVVLPNTNRLPSGERLAVGDTLRYIAGDKIEEYNVVTSNLAVQNGAVTFTSVLFPVGTTIHNSTAAARPPRNDQLYKVGDYVFNANGVIYGPYVVGAASDVDAWPLKLNVIPQNRYVDVTTGIPYKLVVDNGVPYLEETI